MGKHPKLPLNPKHSTMQNFQVNLEGIINLLSNHLYSSNDVFLRELLQNGVDAITARQLAGETFQPKIEVSYVTAEESQPIVIFSDNGIGLNEEEVTQFLTQIGSSSKRGEDIDRSHFIGQFGIGLLSCFMVTDKIIMTTQSVKADYALEWTGESNGRYYMQRMPKKEHPGTTVYIHLKEDVADQFSAERVPQILKEYGGLLPFPIRFGVNAEEVQTLNFDHNPLGKPFSDHQAEQEALLEFGLEQFGQHFLAGIPLNLPSGETQGIAFVRKRSHISDVVADKVYVKGMLLSDKVDNILPRWAFFLKSVINTNKLQPTASRERFYQNDDLEYTRKRIGKMIRNKLMEWNKTQPVLLRSIIDTHQRAIKQMAEEDQSFLKIVWPYLRFPTTQGQLTIPEIRKIDPCIRYIYELETYQQLRSFAGAQNLLIVKTRYENDMALLHEIHELNPEWELVSVEVQDLFGELEELSAKEKGASQDFITRVEPILQELGCEIILRKFEPDHVPTICYLEPGARLDRTSDYDTANLSDLWQSLSARMKQVSVQKQATLCLNFRNESVQRLVNVKEEHLLRLYIRFLYFQAILLGNYTLTSKEMSLFTQNITDMIDLYEQHGPNSFFSPS